MKQHEELRDYFNQLMPEVPSPLRTTLAQLLDQLTAFAERVKTPSSSREEQSLRVSELENAMQGFHVQVSQYQTAVRAYGLEQQEELAEQNAQRMEALLEQQRKNHEALKASINKTK